MTKTYPETEFEHDPELDIYTCINCGATAKSSPSHVRHYDGCEPGDAAKWEDYYSQPEVEIQPSNIRCADCGHYDAEHEECVGKCTSCDDCEWFQFEE